MEKNGIIKKYTIEISEDLFEKKTEFLLILKSREEEILGNEKLSRIYKISGDTYVVLLSVSDIAALKNFFNSKSTEIVTMYPVIEKIERKIIPKIAVKFHCDYCGKEVVDEPIVFKLHNKVYFFCCNTCLREFKKKVGV